MDQEHEYALLGGRNRAAIGRYLGMLAAAVSSGIVFLLLTAIDIAKRFGIPANLPPSLLSLAGAGAIYSALYFLFNRHFWKLPALSAALRLPDLSGSWACEGTSLNADRTVAHEWHGEITIVQRWDRIRVRLKTTQSGSNSITAALAYDEADGYRLLYSYRNDPRIGEAELTSHRGVADLLFAKNKRSAEGEYFNGLGRFTFGTMRLTKKEA